MYDKDILGRLLTVKETCERAHIGRTTLYELVRAGRLKSVKIGKRGVRIPVTELERFIREGLGEGN